MFDQIKAKLGLDITDFQRGISGAQRGVGELAKSTTKGFTDLKNVGGTLATALGLNVQSIAESIARFVVGFSKDQEQALNDLVDATGKAADAQVAASKKAAQERDKLDKDIAAKEEEYRLSKLTDEERTLELSTRLGQIMTERAKLEKQGMQSSSIYARLKNEQLDVEKELRGFEEKKNKSEAESIENQRRIKEELESGVAQVVSMITETQKENTAEEEKQVELAKEKRRELEAQKKAMEGQLRDARRDAVLPTMAEVSSGARNIGDPALRKVQDLEKERARSLRLADRYQRDFDRAFDPNVKGGQRTDALRQLKQTRDALTASQERIKVGQESLQFRVKDANPFGTMESELKGLNEKINTLNNNTLGPTSISTT